MPLEFQQETLSTLKRAADRVIDVFDEQAFNGEAAPGASFPIDLHNLTELKPVLDFMGRIYHSASTSALSDPAVQADSHDDLIQPMVLLADEKGFARMQNVADPDSRTYDENIIIRARLPHVNLYGFPNYALVVNMNQLVGELTTMKQERVSTLFEGIEATVRDTIVSVYAFKSNLLAQIGEEVADIYSRGHYAMAGFVTKEE